MSDDTEPWALLLRRYIGFCVRHPFLVIAVFLGLGGVSTAIASRLEFHGDFIELLPETSQEVKDLKYVEKKAGGGGYLIVQVTGAEKADRQKFAEALAPALEKKSDVIRYVEHRFDIEFFKKRALLLLATDKLKSLRDDVKARLTYEKKIANPLFVDLSEDEPPADFNAIQKKYGADVPQSEYLESKDGKELYLYVKPAALASDLDFDRRLAQVVADVSAEVQKGFPGIHVAQTGAYVIRVEEDETMKGDLTRASWVSALIALGLIVFGTRRISALSVVFVPVTIGIAATFAFAFATVGHLNPVTGFLAAILIGLGIEYGVHLSMRYWEERRDHTVEAALGNAVVGTFIGALTSAGTNAAAFAVLMLAEFAAFRQFGLIASAGVVLTVLAGYGMGPAILVVAERIRPWKGRGPTGPESQGGVDLTRGHAIPSFALMGFAAALIGFAGFSVSVLHHVGFESDLRRLKGESPATDLDDHITKQLGIVMAPALLYVNDLATAKKVAAAAQSVKDSVGEASAIQKVASLNDMLPDDVDARLEILADLKKSTKDIPESLLEGEHGSQVKAFLDMLEAKPWGVEEVPLEIRRRFRVLEGDGTFVLLFPRFSGYNVDELQLWRGEIDRVLEKTSAQSMEVRALDGNRIAAKIFSLIKHDGPFVMGCAALVVFLMIALGLKSLFRGLQVAVPLYIGFLCLGGVMYFIDLKLNFLNVVVLPCLLAIAVDNSVHLYHRYLEEGPGSLGHVLRHTGFAAFIATISNAAGFGAMLVAHHAGLRSIGTIAIIGVSATFSGTTLLFPAMLELQERFRNKGKAGAPGPSAH